MKPFIAILLIALVMGIGAWALWDRIAVFAAPKKQAISTRGEAASKADEVFWDTFHNGRVHSYPGRARSADRRLSSDAERRQNRSSHRLVA